ncbi:MAG TPA: response regulator transcription factor [Vicinamibacteria bacterium]|nr:response regulator transcription factor [Vicinamibacteria bacterium]
MEGAGFTVAGQAGDGREAVRLARELRPEVAVLDLGMPLLNGLDAAREIRQAVTGTAVVLLTLHREEQYVLEALRSGVRGYVLKTQASGDLIEALAQVLRGSIYLSMGITRVLVDAYLSGNERPHHLLTPRERQVLQLVAEGKTTKEVAQVLGLSVKTADSHRTRLMQKLDIHETAGLVRYAIRSGLVQP